VLSLGSSLLADIEQFLADQLWNGVVVSFALAFEDSKVLFR
jgi:hypothetical protein